MKRLIGLVLLAVAANAIASEWLILGDGPQASVSIERTTLKRNGSHALVWMKLNYRTPMASGSRSFDEQTSHVDINCANDTGNLSTTIFRLKGNIVYSENRPEQIEVIPDTAVASVEQAVCKSS
jgi:hypothetical protein